MLELGRKNSGQGTVVVHPDAKTRPHHPWRTGNSTLHRRGRARFRWEPIWNLLMSGPGDFIYVPPFVPHQELNARRDEPVEAVVLRSGQEPIVINLDIPSPESVPDTPQPDPFHSAPGKP